jgi:hypothetical protein
MKRLRSLLAIFTVFAFAAAPLAVRAQDAPPPPPDDQGQGAPPPPPDAGDDQGGDQGGDVSYQTFYDNLSDDGTWIQTDDYGYVFQPTVDDPNWAPYTDGHWAYSDDGWVWVSDEPWGWATYHYGRWANLDGVGWVWVPGYQWAPAWVSWRYGGGYCGWAPLPPGADYGRGGPGGFHFGGDVDASFHIGAGYYNFVPQGRLGDPNVRGAIINRNRNFTMINRTTNITNINVGQNFGNRGNSAFRGVTAGGPPIAEINAHASHRVPTVQLTTSNAPGRATVRGNSLAMFAPRVNAATAHQARPASVGSNIGRASINPGNSASRPLTANANARTNARTTAMPNAGNVSPSAQTFHSAQTPSGGQTFHPQTQSTPTFHPQAQGNAGIEHTQNGATFHPQAQSAPAIQHTQGSIGTFHPQNEGGQVEHHSQAPATSFHPQSQGGGQVEHHSAPAMSFHPQSQAAPPQQHSAPAMSFHPQSQAAPPQQHSAPPAPHPSAAPAGKPAPGGGKDDKHH